MSFSRRPKDPDLKRHVGVGSTSVLLRSGLLGLVAIGGATGALVRHYTHVFPPMLVPRTPASAPTYDVDAGEIPLPEYFAEDDGGER